MKKILLLLSVVVLITMLASACDGETTSQREVREKAFSREVYVPQNDMEYKNYEKRQRIADDPTTILWCTSAFPIPSSPLFTIPVVGKLTSGAKRPYPTEYGFESSTYPYSELPGPDGMFGPSGEYRYGFTPAGIYVDFYNIATFCSTEPTVWQRDETVIVLERAEDLVRAQEQARDLLRAGDTAGAQRVLEEAIRAAQGD